MKKYIFALIALVGLVQCQKSSEPVMDKVSEVATDPMEWETVVPTKGTSLERIKFPGIFEPQEDGIREVSFPSAVKVDRYEVEPGQQVARGEIVAYISHPNLIQYQSDYFEALAAFEAERLHYERWSSLRASNQASESEWTSVEFQFKKARNNVAASKAVLETFGIVPKALQEIQALVPVFAPISGQIQELSVATGGYLQSETALLRVVDPNKKRVVANLAPELSERIKTGDSAVVKLFSQTISASVKAVGNGTTDQQPKVWLTLHDNIGAKAGTPVAIEVISRGLTAWSVPASAILYEGNQAFIVQTNPKDQELVRTNVELLGKTSQSVAVRFSQEERLEWPVVIKYANRAYAMLD